jgi:hypothetical protein
VPLRASTSDLRSLADGSPKLVDAQTGEPTGATLVRYLGAGGMSTVFLAEIARGTRLVRLRPDTPQRVAVKFMLPETERAFAKINIASNEIFRKEEVALGRVTERKPSTEFVVGFYGSGTANVSVGGAPEQLLPWLAIEYVDGGAAGTSLTDRVRRAVDGVDPVRALRLVKGIVEGVQVLHSDAVKVIHRDLKPDNVLVAGPIDDETPKLADCGIARVEGMAGMSFAAMTPAYGGPEQAIGFLGQPNPLIGPWTDIHALAAVVWFLIGGEQWCKDEFSDRAWQTGTRRSLRTATRMHAGFANDMRLLDRLDAVLTRGAAHRLPAAAWEHAGADKLSSLAKGRYPSIFAGDERYASASELAGALVPVLEEIAAAWGARAVRENTAMTAFRATQLVRAEDLDAQAPLAKVRELPRASLDGTDSTLSTVEPVCPGGVVFQPDGKILARFGERLVYFVGQEPHKVSVDPALAARVAAARWVVRGPGGGFAIVGPRDVLLVRGGRIGPMALPVRAGGGDVGEVQAVVGDGRVFGLVTAETDDSNGGAELWRSTDGTGWLAPTVLPLNGDVHAIADGPFGLLAVGSKGGKRGRALFVGFDGQTTLYTAGVSDKPALVAAVCGAARESWAAGAGVVLRFDRGAVASERVDATDVPAAMALDVVGVPWLVTERAVLRRHIEAGDGVWKAYVRRPEDRPAFVGIGFTPEGARVLDARGGVVEIEPVDVGDWRARVA